MFFSLQINAFLKRIFLEKKGKLSFSSALGLKIVIHVLQVTLNIVNKYPTLARYNNLSACSGVLKDRLYQKLRIYCSYLYSYWCLFVWNVCVSLRFKAVIYSLSGTWKIDETAIKHVILKYDARNFVEIALFINRLFFISTYQTGCLSLKFYLILQGINLSKIMMYTCSLTRWLGFACYWKLNVNIHWV